MDFEWPEEVRVVWGLVQKFVQKEFLSLKKQVDEKDEFSEDIRQALKKKVRDLGCSPSMRRWSTGDRWAGCA